MWEHSEEAQKKLATAVQEGRLSDVPILAIAYTQMVRQHLADGSPKCLEQLLTPLVETITLLRVKRAHDAAKFKELAFDSAYKTRSSAGRGRTVNFEA